MAAEEALDRVEVLPYDPAWPEWFGAERLRILDACSGLALKIEHIGSTAVPGLNSKPIIDIMIATSDMREAGDLAGAMAHLGYELITTGMEGRLFLRRRSEIDGQVFQAHIVERRTWDDRKERIMRDYLLSHPEWASAYGDLKASLAAEHRYDSLAYTRAKTEFIQTLMDRARAECGLPPIDVWAS